MKKLILGILLIPFLLFSENSKYTLNDYAIQKAHDIKLIDNLDGTYSQSFSDSFSGDFAGRVNFNSTFGEKVVGSRVNNINIPFSKNNGNIGSVDFLKSTKFFSSGTGTQSNTNEVGFVHTGTGVGYAEIRSKNTNRYVTGHGNDAFHTMVFPTPQIGVDSWVGYGSLTLNDFIGYGYKGLDFGIWIKLRGVENFVKQSDWNVNKLPTLNPNKENISGTSFGWLGVADIDFFIYGENNKPIHVHKFKTANVDDKPHLSDPTQPISIGIRRVSGSGTDVKVGTSSWYAGTVGERATGTGQDRFPFIERNQVSIPANTETILLSIRNKDTFSGKPNTVRLRYGTITITSDGTKPVAFRVYINGVNRNVGTWGDYDSDLSVSELNIDSPLVVTTDTIVTGLTRKRQQIGGTYLGKTDRDRINLFSTDVVISANAGDIITITAFSPNSTVVDFEIRWIEEF